MALLSQLSNNFSHNPFAALNPPKLQLTYIWLENG